MQEQKKAIDKGKEKETLVEQLFPNISAEDHPVIREIQSLDPLAITPLEALIKLTKWKQELSENSDEAEEVKDS